MCCFGLWLLVVLCLVCYKKHAAQVHVETGLQPPISHQEHLICVLWSLMKLCMRVLALSTCLSNFPSSLGFVFTSISHDIWSVMRKKSFVCMLRFLLTLLDRCFPGASLFSSLATPCTYTYTHTCEYVPDGFPPAWWISHRADSNEKKDNCVPSTAEPCSSCQH